MSSRMNGLRGPTSTLRNTNLLVGQVEVDGRIATVRCCPGIWQRLDSHEIGHRSPETLDDAEHLAEVLAVRARAGGPNLDLARVGRAGEGRPAILAVRLLILRRRESQRWDRDEQQHANADDDGAGIGACACSLPPPAMRGIERHIRPTRMTRLRDSSGSARVEF